MTRTSASVQSQTFERGASDTFVALDLEATGMDPSRHEIIEIALVGSTGSECDREFHSIVQPSSSLPLAIARLTGIEPAELKTAPTLSEIAPNIRRFISAAPVVAHSIELDLGMLAAAGVELSNERLDTYQLATLLLPDLPNYSLSTVASHLDIPADRGHRALDDARVTAAVFRALLARLRGYDVSTLNQLASLARQAGWQSSDLFARVARDTASAPMLALDSEQHTGPHEIAFLVSRERPEPLRVVASGKPLPVDEIDAALAPSGVISTAVPSYENRPQQRAMAKAVATAFNEDQHLLVEAGTGTGKSLAYLLPAALHAVEQGETVVISTNTLALQDQLYRKDIPDLRHALERLHPEMDIRATRIKGRNNYLCLRRWFSGLKEPVLDPGDAGLRGKVMLWLTETDTGDRAELRLDQAEDQHWRQLSAEEHACVASRCVYQQRNQCFLFRARREAEGAHLVVANHALLLSDIVAGSHVLPPYEHLVIDEAHHLEDQATKHFGFSVDERTLQDALDAVVRVDGGVTGGALPIARTYIGQQVASSSSRRRAEAAGLRSGSIEEWVAGCRGHLQQLFAQLEAILDSGNVNSGFGRPSVRLTSGLRANSAWSDIEIAWDNVDQSWRSIESELRWFLNAVEAAEPEPGTPAEDPRMRQFDDVSSALISAIRGGSDLVAQLSVAMTSSPDEMVTWLERSPVQARLGLHAAPLRVNSMLQEQLFGRLRTAVLTSATLATDGSFNFMADRLGLEDAQELLVASPFDYAQSTLLYLADDVVEPNNARYQQQVHQTLITTCSATRGRALVLFTSHAALQAAYKAIKAPLERDGIVVLAQRTDGSPRQLIERLRHSPGTVVLGTASFWEGIDVAGDALSLLVITKLPFSVPSDPIFAARGELIEEEGGHPFLDYAVPTAVLKFKQGFGRLIRSSQDRGVCVVLDRRVISKRYGSSFVESLPDCALTVGNLADVPGAAARWIDG